MNILHRPAVTVFVSALGFAAAEAAAQVPTVASPVASVEKGVLSLASGLDAGTAAAEPVTFFGQAAITGKVIYDTVFGAPPVLEISIDLSGITGKGQRTGRSYQVATQAILHRPLVPFDAIEVGISFAADANPALARAALASFSVQYSAATGMTATPVRIVTLPPG